MNLVVHLHSIYMGNTKEPCCTLVYIPDTINPGVATATVTTEACSVTVTM